MGPTGDRRPCPFTMVDSRNNEKENQLQAQNKHSELSAEHRLRSEAQLNQSKPVRVGLHCTAAGTDFLGDVQLTDAEARKRPSDASRQVDEGSCSYRSSQNGGRQPRDAHQSDPVNTQSQQGTTVMQRVFSATSSVAQ